MTRAHASTFAILTIKILFWLFVAIDAVALLIFGLLGLAAAKPSHTNPIAALVIPFFIPAAILIGAILLFLNAQATGARIVALLVAAFPLLFVVGSWAVGMTQLLSYRDAAGNIREFRSPALRDIEAAIASNDAAAVATAVRGADLNTPGISGATVLVLALRHLRDNPDGLDVVKALLAAGADPNIRGNELPLQAAIGASHKSGPEPVRLLLEAGANPNARDEWGNPAFFTAGGARLEVMQLLLAHGADVQLRDKQGASAVVLPAQTRNWRVLELLLQRGAPWRDQKAIVGEPFLVSLEGEQRKAESRGGNTDGLAEVMALLRKETR
jgi:hypothetical protein